MLFMGPFIFRALVYPYHSAEPGQGICFNVLIAFQELQSVLTALNGFISYSKVVPLHLDNNTAKSYSCSQDDTVSLLSRCACDILYLATKHSTAYFSIQTHPFQCGGWLSIMGEIGFSMASFSLLSSNSVQIWGQPEGPYWPPYIPVNVSITMLCRVCCLWETWDWTFATILGILGELSCSKLVISVTEHLVEVVDKLSTTAVVFFRSERILKCKHLYGA